MSFLLAPLFACIGIITGYIRFEIKLKKIKSAHLVHLRHVFICLILGLILARVGAFIQSSDTTYSTQWLDPRNGGFVFYWGAIPASLLFLYLTKRSCKQNEFYLIISSALTNLLIAQSLGRIGCFFAGCCFGKEFHLINKNFRHPTPLYESFLLLLFIYTIENKKIEEKTKFFLLMTCSALVRLFTEIFRDDPDRFYHNTNIIPSVFFALSCFLYGAIKLVLKPRKTSTPIK